MPPAVLIYRGPNAYRVALAIDHYQVRTSAPSLALKVLRSAFAGSDRARLIRALAPLVTDAALLDDCQLQRVLEHHVLESQRLVVVPLAAMEAIERGALMSTPPPR